MSAKTCTKCGETKPLDAFSKKGFVNGVQRYRADCKGCIAQYSASQRATSEAVRAARVQAQARYRKADWARHPEKWRARSAEWKARRRAHARNGVSEAYSRTAIFAAYNGTCAYCDAPAEHLDHVIALALGGADAAHNLLPACAPCNLTKGAKTLAEWALTFGT